MTTVAPLAYSPYDYGIHEDPYPTYARLRAEAPVFYNEELDFFAFARHADVLAAFRDVDRYSNAYGVSLDPAAFGPDAHRAMSFLAMDPPRHTRMRSIVGKSFTPRRVAAMEDNIRALAVAHLAPALEAGSFDFIADFAGLLPMDVISELVGVPAADRAEIRRLADLLMHREDGMTDIPAEGLEAALTLAGYYGEMVADRRRHEHDDLTWSLLQAEIDGDRLTDDEVIGFLFLLVVAGNETTTKLLGNAWYWGWRNPDQRAKPFADPARVPDWVEETLRYDTSTQMLVRVTSQPVRVQDVDIEADRRVLLLLGLGQPRRGRLPRPRALRPRAPHPGSGQLRQRAPLLHGRRAGPHGGAGRADRVCERVKDYEVDPSGMGARALHQRARLRRVADDRDAALMPRFEPHPERRPTAVTGASSGIGAEAARALARSGHPVVLGARRVEVCEEVAASIRAEGGDAVACHLDLADPGSVTGFAKEADAAFGPIEILVSNAAKIQPGTALETSPEDFEEVLRVNIGGAQRLVRAFGAGMVERRRGDLVFVTSDVVAHPRPRMAAYVASKWGLEGFVTALQMELEGTGVRAVIVRPGPTLTGMGMDWDPDVTGEVLASGRAGAWPVTRRSCAPRVWRRPSRTRSPPRGGRTSAWSRSSQRHR